EEDTDVIDPVVRPLERAGYQFTRLRTVEEALSAVEQIRRADLILLDMILPVGQTEQEFGRYTGVGLLRELRETYGIHTAVVALTVVTNSDVLHELEGLDVAEVVHKPVRPSELKERVERVLTT